MENKQEKYVVKIIPLIILSIGIIARLAYTDYFKEEVYKNYTVFQYTHDSFPHTEYIQFVASHLSLPSPEKGLEFPQQPLYYISSGVLYRLFEYFSFSHASIMAILVWYSSFFSIGTLVLGYFLARKISKLVWVQSFFTGVLAFTPAFLYQAGMIGNDPLCTFLASLAFFFLVKYIQENQLKNLVFTLCFAVLAFFTKVSAGIIILAILLALILKYYKEKQKIILKAIYFVFLIGFLCLGISFYRAYIPTTREFRFVESYSYDGQQTDPTRLSYFLSFNFQELLKEGQSFVYGNKNVSRTLPTFLYGSFFFGEYTYDNFTKTYPFMKILMQFIMTVGIILPLGFIINFFYVKKWGIIDYISVFGIAINLLLTISFLYKYPSVCNSDFRYFCPLFLAVLFLSCMGLSRLNEKIKFKFILPVLGFVLISSELCWVVGRIAIRIFTNI